MVGAVFIEIYVINFFNNDTSFVLYEAVCIDYLVIVSIYNYIDLFNPQSKPSKYTT